ncbi:predicted protein [Phaeodactylum tricornutum CCAP 1055/1]|jgi:hypothetical protein|uniref:L domain-like protein n=1 Tax=Phaeodactylum tricornutum (strain CCAP 1055/1) TaxID=556484 RepID=B7GBE4_PHATC|nr:predicted protein [Phaeodactylum tricornutum CCAP 1055/1]EEC44102.1 predicted protein [Phaeodactylum tricornutum CCAP 1055/1]|eukprot:XP_002184353.1 predicted protein [Phaeodactylum tricornutum CCAP 1055/1]
MSNSLYDDGSYNAFRVPFYRTRKFFIGVTLSVMLLIAIVAVVVSGNKGSEFAALGNSSTPRVPEIEVSESTLQENEAELGAALIQLYDRLDIPWNGLYEDATPQGRALQAVAGTKLYASLDRVRSVQRYALGVFYYSTFAVAHPYLEAEDTRPWGSSDFWMSSTPECEWEGITCDDSGRVAAIDLSSNYLSGTLPLELALLDKLVGLNLANNYIFGEGASNDVWSYLPNLQDLMMDDNFVIATTGLPSQMKSLESIQKLSVSYNLLQGVLDGEIIGNMQRLSHLEVESNYISGELPVELGTLPDLVYFYIRRNSLSFNLNKLIVPNRFPKIFALWLDSNPITGTIPSEIGTLTTLTSFSLTNATLTGKIPSEMGNLAKMKRCWLYDNALTGTIPQALSSWVDLQVLEVSGNNFVGDMPQGVCDAITASDYQFKTLSADCTRIACEGCCTECENS